MRSTVSSEWQKSYTVPQLGVNKFISGHFTKSTRIFGLRRCEIEFWIEWYRWEILKRRDFGKESIKCPNFLKMHFPCCLRKITWLFSYFERCYLIQNSILQLSSREHLLSDCTTLRTGLTLVPTQIWGSADTCSEDHIVKHMTLYDVRYSYR